MQNLLYRLFFLQILIFTREKRGEKYFDCFCYIMFQTLSQSPIIFPRFVSIIDTSEISIKNEIYEIYNQ